MRSRMMMIFEE